MSDLSIVKRDQKIMDLIIKHKVPASEIDKVEKKFKSHWKMAQID